MNAAAPEVTVIVPYLRADTTIERALRSVLAQTLSDLEIIAVSDGSTDGSSAIVAALAAEDARVRPMAHAPNRGPSFARNRALEQARGAWIAVLDADDAFEPDRLAALVDAATTRGADVIVDNLMGIDPLDGSEAGVVYGALPASLQVTDILTTEAKASRYNFGYLKPMYRRRFIDEHALRYVEHLRTGEDLLLLAECALLTDSIATVDRPLYRYRLQVSVRGRRPSMMSHSAPRDEDMAAALAALMKRYESSLDPDTRAVFDRRIGDLRDGADVSMFRHLMFRRRVGPALSLLARSTEVRRYARRLVSKKLRSGA